MSEFLQLVFRISLIWFTTTCMEFSAAETNPVCQTDECKMLGEYYLKNMDENGSPCTDFYDYVCHGWPSHNPRPKHFRIWREAMKLNQEVKYQLRDLLEDHSKVGEPYEEQSKAIYSACMKLPYMNKSTPEVIKNYMQKIGNWPMFMSEDEETNLSWTEIHNQFLQASGESALFDSGVWGDPRDNYKIVSAIVPIASPYGMLKRIDKWRKFSRQRLHYKFFLYKVVQYVGPVNLVLLKQSIYNDLEDVLSFRDKMEEIRRNRTTLNGDIITIEEFQSWYDNLAGSSESAQIDWRKVVQSIYKDSKDSYGADITNSSKVFVDREYLQPLAKLLSNTPISVIANHVQLYFAERHVLFRGGMRRELQYSCGEPVFPNATIRYERPREIMCVNNVNVLDGLAKMYVKKYFPDEKRDKITEYMKEAINALKEQIQQSNWMSDSRKQNASEKIDLIRYTIGYNPDLFNRTRTFRDIFDVNPLIVNAMYIPLVRHVFVTAAIMQPPTYTPNVPYVIDYGATTFVLGHELYHGASRAIKETFKDMSLNSSEEIQDEFWDHVRGELCISNHYKNAREIEFDERDIDPALDHKDTDDEDISDVMGLKLAYEMFKKKFEKSNGICPVLPGFEDLSCEKLFFIAFANPFCSEPQLADGTLLVRDKHNLPPMRVNGAVQHMKEFSSAFNCKPDDPMNVETKCHLLQRDKIVPKVEPDANEETDDYENKNK